MKVLHTFRNEPPSLFHQPCNLAEIPADLHRFGTPVSSWMFLPSTSPRPRGPGQAD
ncbi:hypothetical protein WN48_04666 [Eufriesea mexicana]|uniref:Uncharacterized protein n=1 Tax=Eufriesea mexicana TaxID=516756 RepID=A0A310SG50_9HYME|nr:hypothetical protein WN48_04666 [Eufriesea mexicana]